MARREPTISAMEEILEGLFLEDNIAAYGNGM